MLNRKFVIILYSVIFIIIIIYTLIKIRPIISGPEILINPNSLHASSTTRIHNISGTVLRAKELRLFDNQLNTDKNGNWNADILLYNNNNLIHISATDNYGNIIKKTFYITKI